MTHPTWAEHLDGARDRKDIVRGIAEYVRAPVREVEWALSIARRDPHQHTHTIRTLAPQIRDLLYMRSRFC